MTSVWLVTVVMGVMGVMGVVVKLSGGVGGNEEDDTVGYVDEPVRDWVCMRFYIHVVWLFGKKGFVLINRGGIAAGRILQAYDVY